MGAFFNFRPAGMIAKLLLSLTQERKGKERNGTERKGKGRNGKGREGKEREWKGNEWNGMEGKYNTLTTPTTLSITTTTRSTVFIRPLRTSIKGRGHS